MIEYAFFPWAVSALEAAKETKFGTKVACASDLDDGQSRYLLVRCTFVIQQMHRNIMLQ